VGSSAISKHPKSNLFFSIFNFLLLLIKQPQGKGKKQGVEIKGNEIALVWHEKASRTALQTSTLKTNTHSFGADTQHDYSQGNCRTVLSIIIKLE